MIGTKKLSEIEKELRAALTETFGDPVQWLNTEIRESRSKKESTEVLESLIRLFKREVAKKPLKRKVAKTG